MTGTRTSDRVVTGVDLTAVNRIPITLGFEASRPVSGTPPGPP